MTETIGLELVQQLLEHQVNVKQKGDKLKLTGPVKQLPPSLLERIKQHKQSLLAHLIHQQTSDWFDLSVNQQAMWALYKMIPSSPAFNMLFACRLPANVDIDALKHACSLVIERHEMLRSVFRENAHGKAEQAVHQDNTPHWSEIEGTLPEAEAQIMQWSDQPMDLRLGTVRFVLHNSDCGVQHFAYSVHHIAVDFWSCQLMLAELSAIYHALDQAQDVRLPKVNSTYREFVSWQQQYLQSPRGQADLAHWRQTLGDRLPILTLPKDYVRPKIMSLNGNQFRLGLPRETTDNLRALAKAYQLTTSTLILTAYTVWLSVLSGQRDVLVGTPAAIRPTHELEWMIGDFSNPIVVYSHVQWEQTFAQVLAVTQQRMLDAIRYQGAPFATVVEQLKSERTLQFTPVFQAMFLWHKPNQRMLKKTVGVHESIFTTPLLCTGQRGATYDLMLSMVDMEHDLVCNWAYNTDLFSHQRFLTFANSFAELLKRLPEQFERPTYQWLELLAPKLESTKTVNPVPALADNKVAWWQQILARWQSKAASQSWRLINGAETWTAERCLQRWQAQREHWQTTLAAKPKSDSSTPVSLAWERSLANLFDVLALASLGHQICWEGVETEVTPDLGQRVHNLQTMVAGRTDTSRWLANLAANEQDSPDLWLMNVVGGLLFGAELWLGDGSEAGFSEQWRGHLDTVTVLSQSGFEQLVSRSRLESPALGGVWTLLIYGLPLSIQRQYQRLQMESSLRRVRVMACYWSGSQPAEQFYVPVRDRAWIELSDIVPLQPLTPGAVDANYQFQCLLSDERATQQSLCEGVSIDWAGDHVHESPDLIHVNGRALSLSQFCGQLCDRSQGVAPVSLAGAVALNLDSIAETQRAGSDQGWVLWLCPQQISQPKQVHSWLQHQFQQPANLHSGFPAPATIAWVSSIPRLGSGQVDWNLLLALPRYSLSELAERSVSIQVPSTQPATDSHWHFASVDVHYRTHWLQPEFGTPTEDELDANGASSYQQLVNDEILDERQTQYSLGQMLQRTAQQFPTHYIEFLTAQDQALVRISYQQLWQRAVRGAQGLMAAFPKAKAMVAIADNDRDLILGFWSAQLAGLPILSMLAKPAATVLTEAQQHCLGEACTRLTDVLIVGAANLMPAITASVQDQALAVIGFAQLQTQPDDAGVDYSPSDESLASQLPGLNPAQTQPQDLALWLLTSGSSGHSKWVMQSHQAVLYQNLAAAAVLKVTSSDHCLNWMPLDHVGGIIMSHCMFMLHGANQLLVATDTILESPIRLLDLFSHYGITFSWAPNFAYALISQAVQQGTEENNPSWDLSALKTLINGGESVTADTCRQFYQALAPFGLAKGVITPAWGMSETCSITLIHTDYDPFQSDRVSVGTPVAGVSFRVSEPQQQLQIKAPCVSMGYFGTQMPIDADGWFDVGDLASIDQGQVTILGRDTDKLVLQGLNLSSLEVESTLHNLPGVRHGYCVVAAARFVADPSDSLVVILGLPPGGVDASTLNDIRRTVLSAHGVSVRWIVPIPEQQFARTAIGKPKRKLLVQQLLAGAFDDCLIAAETLLGTDHTAPQWNFKPIWQATAVTSTGPQCWQLLWPEAEPVAEPLLEVATQVHEVACSDADWDWSAVNLSHDERPVLWPLMAFAPAQQTLEQGLVWLIQQLHQLVPRLQSETQKPKRLFILVTSGVFHGVGHGSVQGRAGYDSSCYALQALLQSIQQENPGVRIQLVEDDQWSPALLRQVLNEPVFPAVSRLYLGERQIPALTKAPVQLPLDEGAGTVPPAPFNGDERSVLILAGGAGGLGQALLPALLRFCRSRLLIVGRRSEAEVLSVEPTISALFRQHPQRLAYWQTDLSEPDALAELLPYLEQRWPSKSKVIGGLQLIADFYSGMMLDQSTTDNLADIEQLLTTKRISSENLHQWSLQQQQPQTWIHFGSVNGWFGAAFYGVYAAASGIQLQQVNHWQQEFQAKQHGVNHFWLGWSLWRGFGVSAHLADSQQQLARKQGYFALTPTSGWASMLAALQQGEQQLLIGLNEKAFPMQHQIKADGDHPVLDLLSFAQQHKAATNQPKRAPQTPLEESIHGLWCDLLEQADIGIDDNFFTLGGHSLVAAQVTQQLQQQLQRRVPVALFFEHPTIAQLANALGNQTQVPNSQLPRLLLEPIPVVTQRQRIQPSAAQQRLLFLQQLEGDRPTFNIPFGIVVESAMEQAVLQQALDDVVARHRLLHSHFEMAEGSFWLVEDEYQQYPIRVRDLSTSERPMEEAQVLFETMANRNFQLDRAPLFSVELLLLGTQRCALIANAHHTIFDGWSVGVLMNELMASYRHRKTGVASSLPPLEIQYLDFVAWQDQWLNSEELAQQRNYWLQQLQGMPTKLALPTDFPRPPIMAHIGDERHFVVAPALYQRLTQFCEQHNFTLNMVLMAAYGLLLGRYSGQQDLAVGTAVANRRHPQTEALIGMFVNTLVIRHQIAPQNSAQAHLAQMKQTMLAALANEDYPFEQLVEGLQPERDLSSTPLFQAFFVLQNAPLGQSDFSDIEVKPMLRRSTIAKFDLSLQMVELQGELLGGLEFNREVFAGETIERFIQQFQVLLQALLDQPELPVSQLNMQTPAELARDQQWQANTNALTPAKTLWQRLLQHAQQTPLALALQGDGDELSYQQLVERTEQWGAYWQQQGVKPGDKVAVLLPRSVDQVVALLSIMYCGACHVPVDPSYPRQRVQYMLQHCTPRLVVSNADIIQQIDAPDLAWQDVQQIDASLQPQLGVNTDIDLPLYVIYTSGSTGKPKGVEIAQRSMLNLIDFCEQEIRVQPGDSWFAVGSMSFDAAALDLFLPLTQGAKLVLTTQEQVLDAPWLNRTVLQQPGASFMLGTPSIWEHLSQGDWPGCPKLTIMSGGESLKLKLAAKLLAGIDRLFNVYGPTEGTVWATTHQVTELDQRPVPIGKPLTNVRVQVLDQLGQPVLTGVPGELFIGGACVGLGYLSDPANTQKSFVMLPEADGTESRWYRTGDQVRWRDDGLLEFIGRIDHQVKVRGYRIELGEVEQGLLAQSGVKQAMAEVVLHPQQDNMLVAYVQSDQADGLDAKTLKTALAERLPHFMLPSHILICSEYPLTPNGKVDTKALARQVISAAPLAGDRVEPSTDNERQMLAIWQQVLGHDNIGVTDSFFDAGGNSVLVIQLVHRIQQQFGKSVPVTQLFRLGTIAAMVDYIEQDIDPKDTEFDPSSTLVCLQSGRADQTPLVLVHAVNGKADVYAMLAHLMPEEQPIYCLQMPTTEADEVTLTSIDAFAQHYLAELDQGFPGRPLLLGGWSFGGLVAFAMAQRLALQNRPCKGVLLIESSHPDVLRSKKPMSESMVLLLAGVGLGLQLYQIPTELYLMEDEQSALQALLDRLQALQLVTEDFGIEDVIAQRDLIRKNEKAFVEFESQDVVLAGPALVITASSQPKERTVSEDLGWGPHIHSLDVARVEGDHITVMQPPGLNRTVQQVTQWLQQQ